MDPTPSTTAPAPILGTKGLKDEPPQETLETQAMVKDLTAAPSSEKKAIAVDHRLVMSECQLLLAEKRTSYALLRTGVSVALLPLSVWTVLIATSRMWNIWDSWFLIAPLMLVALALFALGVYLIFHAMEHLAHTDRVMMGLRQSDTLLEDLLIKHGRGSRVLKPWTWRHHHH